MGSTFYYLAAPEEDQSVHDWFAALADPPFVRADRAILWFGGHDVAPDAAAPGEPVVTLFPPRRLRHDLWTVGEVHCLARRGAHPDLDRAVARFGTWLRGHPMVFRRPSSNARVDEWNWQLRGSVRNIATSIHALPSGELALSAGTFFVADSDNAQTVDAVLKEIDRLR